MITVEKLITNLEHYILQPIVGLMFALALVFFLLGAFEFIKKDGNRDTAKRHVLWGTIGLFIMVTAYGLINLICTTITVCP